LHWVAPVVHTPQTPAALQYGSPPLHAASFCQAPFASHVCGVFPVHSLLPVAQTPQLPPLQYGVAPSHVALLCHCPFESQV
jgi:hypothetical protein